MSDEPEEDLVQRQLLGVSEGGREDGEYVQKVHRVHVLGQEAGKKAPVCGAEPESERTEMVESLKSAKEDHFSRCKDCEKKNAFEIYLGKFSN